MHGPMAACGGRGADVFDDRDDGLATRRIMPQAAAFGSGVWLGMKGLL